MALTSTCWFVNDATTSGSVVRPVFRSARSSVPLAE